VCARVYVFCLWTWSKAVPAIKDMQNQSKQKYPQLHESSCVSVAINVVGTSSCSAVCTCFETAVELKHQTEQNYLCTALTAVTIFPVSVHDNRPLGLSLSLGLRGVCFCGAQPLDEQSERDRGDEVHRGQEKTDQEEYVIGGELVFRLVLAGWLGWGFGGLGL
jgi:hypothetical protein